MARNPADMHFRRQDFDHSQEMLETFKKIFGLHEFRVNQLEAINATILRENVFVVGGNGAGKSLCYQLPACLSAGVTVVISPLKSLILDQIQKLTQLGIEALTLTADRDDIDAESIYQQLLKIKLLYVTPETMSERPKLIEALQRLLVEGLLARFVIDEAQCISQPDSTDFREAIRTGMLNIQQKTIPGVPMIAVAGPIRDCTRDDILQKLQMTNPQVFTMTGTNQTNLKYAVLTRTSKLGDKDCITWIKEHYPHDSGIMYCWRRVDCDDMAESLNKVICATIAFSMGIHKPDVRYVIHSFLPKSMENYLRESGRAGRDGKLSHCIVFYSSADRGVLCRAICNADKQAKRKKELRDDELMKRELENVGPMVEYCHNNMDCRRKQLLTYIDGVDPEAYVCLPGSEAICDNCERANAGAAAPN